MHSMPENKILTDNILKIFPIFHRKQGLNFVQTASEVTSSHIFCENYCSTKRIAKVSDRVSETYLPHYLHENAYSN